MDIQYFNREKDSLEDEKVYGGKAVDWLYSSKVGSALNNLITQPFVSQLYGAYQDSGVSKKKIRPFLKQFGIDISEFKNNGTEDFYDSFNDFFIREFREGAREFAQKPSDMPAPCEARYLGFTKMSSLNPIRVKKAFLKPKEIVGNAEYAEYFRDGPAYIARLCPVDYHRFHFPDDGRVIESYRVHGVLDSVNPLALGKKSDLFFENERHVTILETKNFGKIAYIEVGAVCVGKIVQSYHGNQFLRGQEKGYFKFGGSTVIVFGEKGKWAPSEDILKHSSEGREVYLKLGDVVAQKI
ncbi:MAG: phosphatidylserine decarboxylase [Bacteriovoracaceae bacterium]